MNAYKRASAGMLSLLLLLSLAACAPQDIEELTEILRKAGEKK